MRAILIFSIVSVPLLDIQEKLIRILKDIYVTIDECHSLVSKKLDRILSFGMHACLEEEEKLLILLREKREHLFIGSQSHNTIWTTINIQNTILFLSYAF